MLYPLSYEGEAGHEEKVGENLSVQFTATLSPRTSLVRNDRKPFPYRTSMAKAVRPARPHMESTRSRFQI